MKFVNEYFRCNMNATEAYSRLHPNVTRETARRAASRLMTNVDISTEIQKRLADAKMGADEVLARLSEQAKGEYAKYIKPDGWVDIERLIEDGKGHLIKSVEKKVKTFRDGSQEEYTTFTFYDGQRALGMVGKHHALFTEKVDVTSKGKSLNVETMKPSEIAERVAALLKVSRDGE